MLRRPATEKRCSRRHRGSGDNPMRAAWLSGDREACSVAAALRGEIDGREQELCCVNERKLRAHGGAEQRSGKREQ